MRDGEAGLSAMIETLVKGLVDRPDGVGVTQRVRSDAIVVELRVDPEDLGKVIGRQGRTARALRTLVGMAGEKIRKRAILQILE